MIGTKIIIGAPLKDIWSWLMEPANWEQWWGDLLEVVPGWQTGATMKWALGLPTKLVSFKNFEALGIESEYLLSTVGLTAMTPGTTEVEIIEAPRGGAGFSDEGSGRKAQLDKALEALKRVIESRREFLGQLTPGERRAVWNLPLDVYESAIREKTSGLPESEQAVPNPAREKLAVLRKLTIEDIRRLKESVTLVMQADLVARGAKVEGPIIVAAGGNASDLLRGAELYSRAARYNPYNDLALMSCGVALARAGFLQAGLPWLLRAQEVNPENDRIKRNIEDLQTDIAKSQDKKAVRENDFGELPPMVRPESIPAFNLIWPPAEPSPPARQPKTIPAAPRAADRAPYASIWLRFAAFVIDGMVLMIPSMIVMIVISPPTASPQNFAAPLGLGLLPFVGMWLYFAIMESSANGATLGKILLGLKVTDMNGNRISFARATGRFFAKLLGILTFYIGFLIAFFTAKKQALHDLVSGCLVISYEKETAKLQLSDLRPAEMPPAMPPAAASGQGESKLHVSTHDRRYTGPPVRDLTQEDVIRQLMAHGMTAKEADASVQVALVLTSTLDSNQIDAIHNSRDPITVKSLALKWAAHCIYHGARPRTP